MDELGGMWETERQSADRRAGVDRRACDHHGSLQTAMDASLVNTQKICLALERLGERVDWLVKLSAGAVTISVATVGVCVPLIVSGNRAFRVELQQMRDKIVTVEGKAEGHASEMSMWRNLTEGRIRSLEDEHQTNLPHHAP